MGPFSFIITDTIYLSTQSRKIKAIIERERSPLGQQEDDDESLTASWDYGCEE